MSKPSVKKPVVKPSVKADEPAAAVEKAAPMVKKESSNLESDYNKHPKFDKFLNKGAK